MNPTLIEHLKSILHNEKHGIISFANFMTLALYHPQYGYYNANDFYIGRDGGAFMTAPEISPLFAQCFAQQCLQIFNQGYSQPYILELGAGSGRFALTLLTELEKHHALPTHYYIYDISCGLRKKQQDLLRDACPQFMSRIIWLKDLKDLPQPFSGIIIGNEVLDALPVHCFSIDDNGINEKYVAIDPHDPQEMRLSWKIKPANNPVLIQEVSTLRRLYDLPCRYESEINLHLKTFMTEITSALHQGVILFADYGYGQREYYHHQRTHGTLSTIYRGARINDPLQYPGQQDITAHVDFTRVAEYASDGGCTLAGYTTQAAFLLSSGLIDLAARMENNTSATHESFQMHQAIKYLTLPSEMGERVKVMALVKGDGMDIGNMGGGKSLLGFNFKDNRREL